MKDWIKRKMWLWGLSGVVLLGSFYVFYQTYMNMPDFTVLRSTAEIQTVKRDGSKGTKRVGPKAPGWVPLSNISDGVTFAVVASEDTSYFSHQGVDLHELKEAIKKDIKERRFARGASTITQQVIKNVFLSREKTLWRKFREILWAREMDKVLTKSEVLNFYLNMVEWGPGIYGIGEAAQHYFGSSPAYLSPKQGAFLAMLLPSPRRYYQSFKEQKLTDFASRRVKKILRIMVRMKFITEPQHELAMNESLFGESVEDVDNAIAVDEDRLIQQPPDTQDVRDVVPDTQSETNIDPALVPVDEDDTQMPTESPPE